MAEREPEAWETPGYWQDWCYLAEEGTPHAPHPQRFRHCEHDRPAWCYGLPEPGSVEAQVAGLRVGDRVRVVSEITITEPVKSVYDGAARDSVVGYRDGEREGMLVLRYTGSHPASADDARRVAGFVNPSVVSVEVLREP